MFDPNLISSVSGGRVTPRHSIRRTSPGHYDVGGDPGQHTITFYGKNADGTGFTSLDDGGQFDAWEDAQIYADELTQDHAAFIDWWNGLAPGDRAYLQQRASLVA